MEAEVVPNKTFPGDGHGGPGLADGWANGAGLGRCSAGGELPDSRGVRAEGEVGNRIVAARSRGDRDSGAAKHAAERIGIIAGRESGIQTGDGKAGAIIFVDGYEHHVIEELALEDVDVVVDPALRRG